MAFKPPIGLGCSPFLGGGSVVVTSLLIVTPIVGFCNCSMLSCALPCVHSSFAIILMGKRESWLLCFVCLHYDFRVYTRLLDEAKACSDKLLPEYCKPSYDIIMSQKIDDYKSFYGLNLTSCDGKPTCADPEGGGAGGPDPPP